MWFVMVLNEGNAEIKSDDEKDMIGCLAYSI